MAMLRAPMNLSDSSIHRNFLLFTAQGGLKTCAAQSAEPSDAEAANAPQAVCCLALV